MVVRIYWVSLCLPYALYPIITRSNVFASDIYINKILWNILIGCFVHSMYKTIMLFLTSSFDFSFFYLCPALLLRLSTLCCSSSRQIIIYITWIRNYLFTHCEFGLNKKYQYKIENLYSSKEVVPTQIEQLLSVLQFGLICIFLYRY